MKHVERLEREISSWPGVSTHSHRFGGREFRFKAAEIGHVHTDGTVDIPFPRSVRDALLAEAICQVVRNGDDREVMVGLAVFYYVAQQLGLVPSDLFDEVTSCLPDGWIPDLLREFGARQDTLSRPSHGNWSRHLMGRTSCLPCRKLTDKRPKLPV